MHLCTARANWEDNYPKLQFGSQALSPNLNFPDDFGAYPPNGRHPHQLIFRFKVKAGADATVFAQATEMQIHLPDFAGGDNTWSKNDEIKFHSDAKVSNGVIQASGHFNEARWVASTSTLTIKLDNFADANADIRDSEYILVLNAGSFVHGGGPMTPTCLALGAPIYISKFLSGAVENADFRSRFGKVAAIGCFGERKAAFGIEENAWIVKSIGQDPQRSGLGIETTLTVTLASKLDLSSVSSAADSIQTTIQLTGLTGSGTEDEKIAILEHPSRFSSIDGKFSADGMSNFGEWERDEGRLTLTITDDETLPAGIPFVFQFKLQLPSAVQESPSVSISLRTGATFVIETQPMLRAEGDAAPLKATEWKFLSAHIGQSVSGPGQENTVTVTLKTNFDMQVSYTFSAERVCVGVLVQD